LFRTVSAIKRLRAQAGDYVSHHSSHGRRYSEGRRAVQLAEELAAEAEATLHLALVLPARGIWRGLVDYDAPGMTRLLEEDRFHVVDGEEQQIEAFSHP
jgi:hypothetical protein